MRHNNKFGLVTGAAGFLGIVHCESILEKYDGLIMVDINKNKMLKNYQYLKKKLLRFFILVNFREYIRAF